MVFRIVTVVHNRKVTKSLSCLLFILSATICTFSHAGEERSGFSRVAGVFMSFETGGLISFDSVEKYQALVDHCHSGRQVFNHTREQAYGCRVVLPIDPENGSPARVHILGVTPRDTHERPHVFTFGRPRPKAFKARDLTAKESDAVATLLRNDKLRYGSLLQRLDLKVATAVERPGGSVATIFVPGEIDKDEDGHYEARRHHVFVTQGDAIRYQGKLGWQPRQYLDLDGDDYPEVVTEAGCDGMCTSLWSIHNGPKPMANLGGH